MGLISLPAMLRAGYDKSLATGVIVASGTLGQIIPPSIVLVVLGDQLGISVGDLFIGALLPGLLMSAVFAIYVLVISALKPELAPELKPELTDSGRPLRDLGPQGGRRCHPVQRQVGMAAIRHCATERRCGVYQGVGHACTVPYTR